MRAFSRGVPRFSRSKTLDAINRWNNLVWKFNRIPNVPALTYNIPNCRDERPDPRFCPPKSIIYGLCEQPDAIFDDLIYSRHINRIDQFDGKEFFSLMVSARTLAGKQFLQALWTIDIRSQLITHYEDDERIRIGITATHDDRKAKALVFKMLKVIHDLAALPDNFWKIANTFMADNFVETDLLKTIHYDPDCRPVYFDNQKNTLPFGSYYATYREDDADFGRELPLIHQAILDNNRAAVEALLVQNPEFANKKDPFGITALQLAFYLGPLGIYELLVDARKHCLPKSPGDYQARRCEQHIIKTWRETGFNAVIHWGFSNDEQSASKQFSANRAKYLTLIKTSIPLRSSLHLACINGDSTAVKIEIEAAPERLNEKDPRGYTPLILAAANGHAKLVSWLIQLGASREVMHQCVFGGSIILRLIDNASTPEVLQVVLKHDSNLVQIHERFIAAIRENQVFLATYLSNYLRKWPEYRGLSALELAFRLSSEKNGVNMVENLLMAHPYPVVEGPYDTDLDAFLASKIPHVQIERSLPFNIHAALPPLLEAHTRRIKAETEKKAYPVKWMQDYIQNECLISVFSSKKIIITSYIKRVENLTDEERKSIHDLFFRNFEMMTENTTVAEEVYLSEALKDDATKPGYVNLFYHEKTLVSFMTFESFEIDNKLVFHGKLAANFNDALYNSQKLIALAFRAAFAMKLLARDQQVVVYCKVIYPGLGLIAALPGKETPWFPKNQQKIPASFVEKIVAETGEFLHDEKILAKLQLKKSSRKVHKTQQSLFFPAINGANEKAAMAICFEIGKEAMHEYMSTFQLHAINPSDMDHFSQLWREFSFQPSQRPASIS